MFCVSFMCVCLKKATLWADAGPVSKKNALTSTQPTTRRQLCLWGWGQEGSGLAVKANVCPRTDAPDDSTPIEAFQGKAAGPEAPMASGTSITLGGSHPVYCVGQ